MDRNDLMNEFHQQARESRNQNASFVYAKYSGISRGNR